MAGLVVARLRHRPAQAALVALLSGVVALCAVLAVAYARAVEESVQRQALTAARQADRGVSVGSSGSASAVRSPEQLRDAVRPALRDPAWGTPVAGAQADGLVPHGRRPVVLPVVSRDDVCGHLRLTSGRCATGAGQALVSRRTADLLGLAAGDRLDVRDTAADPAAPAALRDLTVAGVYAAHAVDDAYWFDRPLAATVPTTQDAGAPVAGDAVLVGWPTLRAGRWGTVSTTLDVPLRPAQVTIGRTATVRASLGGVQRAATAAGAAMTTQLPAVLDAVPGLRAQARAPLPLLGVQLVVLALVVLGYVAAATTEQRRLEVALARLRGQQPVAAALAVVRELGPLVLGGCVAGGALGWLAAALAARAWLAAGVPVPLRWPLLLAVAGAAAVGVAAVAATAVPTVREPLVTLLRAVPPRGAALRAGLVDGVVVALCAAGVVTVLTGDPGDPTALLAPGLLALAGGLVLSQLVVPAAGLAGGAALRRGRLVTALSAVAVARRPALRRLVAIVTVAVGLLVFAVAAGSVAADQRRVSAARELGAPAVLEVQAPDLARLRAAVASADPGGRLATPVLVATSATAQGPRTLAVDPAGLARTALWGRAERPGAGAPAALRLLEGRRPAAVVVRGGRLSLTVRLAATAITARPGELDPATGLVPAPGLRRPVRLHLLLTGPDAVVHDVDLGALRRGAQRLSARVPCAGGCRLRQVQVRRAVGDGSGALITVTVSSLDAGAGPVDLRAGDGGWTALPGLGAPVELVRSAAAGLTVRSRSFGTDLLAQRADVPAHPPVLVAGALPPSGLGVGQPGGPAALVDVPGPSGLVRTYTRAGSLAAVPGAPAPVAVVALRDVELDPGLDPGVAQQVWLSDGDPAVVARLGDRLRRAGVEVTGSRTAASAAAGLAREGPGAALRLAAVAGVVAVLLAACVLAVSVAASGRVRARDLAGLRVAGVPARVARRAAVREQLAVALVGVASGSVLGAAGVALTLGRGRRDGLAAPDLAAAWPAGAVAVLVCAGVLGGTCALLGSRLAGRARPSLLREGPR